MHAKSLGVFKVETVGDSYIAVMGVPEANKKHASIMVRFARKCLQSMLQKTRLLEMKLGPSTRDLRARVGLHTGPVTAGVLRGEKARFQLFGDTVNMASRMEATGIPHCIQCSGATYDALVKEGKGSWVRPRDEVVSVKGKGYFQTYWVDVVTKNTDCSTSSFDELEDNVFQLERALESGDNEMVEVIKGENRTRLIEWNTEVLYGLLETWMSNRTKNTPVDQAGVRQAEEDILNRPRGSVLEEFSLVLTMPEFRTEPLRVEAYGSAIKTTLFNYVREIAELYRDVRKLQNAVNLIALTPLFLKLTS